MEGVVLSCNRQAPTLQGKQTGEGWEGGTWLYNRSCRGAFQGWLGVATGILGSSQEALQTSLHRNPRNKLSPLVSKNGEYQWRNGDKGKFLGSL